MHRLECQNDWQTIKPQHNNDTWREKKVHNTQMTDEVRARAQL